MLRLERVQDSGGEFSCADEIAIGHRLWICVIVDVHDVREFVAAVVTLRSRADMVPESVAGDGCKPATEARRPTPFELVQAVQGLGERVLCQISGEVAVTVRVPEMHAQHRCVETGVERGRRGSVAGESARDDTPEVVSSRFDSLRRRSGLGGHVSPGSGCVSRCLSGLMRTPDRGGRAVRVVVR